MSDFIERARALDKAATPGPWRHWPEAGDIEIVTDDYRTIICPQVKPKDGWPMAWEESSAYRNGDEHDAELIASARTMLPAAVEALARVRELHRKHGLYELEDACTNTSEEHRQERHHEASDEVGEFYCEDMPVGAVCDTCRDEDGERVDWPCATYQATEVEA